MAERGEKSPAGPERESTIEDGFLVRRFNQGDGSAFERIVEENSADIAELANRLLGWPGDVEDVVQDTFLAAYQGLKRFRCECSLKTWLFTITINQCRNHRYRQMLRLKAFRASADNASVRAASGADKKAMGREGFERIRRAMKALPAKYREPVVLKYLQELPSDEISKILGISRNTLQVRLSRARRRLRQGLAGLIEE